MKLSITNRDEELKALIKDTIFALRFPNEFEIMEYLEADGIHWINDIDIEDVRRELNHLLEYEEVFRCKTKSTVYKYRYTLQYTRTNVLEPKIIPKSKLNSTELLHLARKNNDTKTLYDFELHKDPYRDNIVFFIKDESLLGIADFRVHKDNQIRLPTRYYENTLDGRTIAGRTELQYISSIMYDQNVFQKGLPVRNWLAVEGV